VPLCIDWRCSPMIGKHCDDGYSSFVLARCALGHERGPFGLSGIVENGECEKWGTGAGGGETKKPQRMPEEPRRKPEMGRAVRGPGHDALGM
jgi:hypothetical protein